MRAGRIAQGEAIAKRIQKAITQKSSKWMRNLDTRNGVKDAWAKVRQVVRGCNSSSDSIAGEVTAQKLNDHYADIN